MKALAHRLAVCALLAGLPAALSAQTPLPSVDSIVAALAPEATGPMVRSMSQSGALPMAATTQIPLGFDFAALNLQVEFDRDSHMLTTAGMTTLRTVAAALRDPRLAGSRFQVAGHTVPGAADAALTLSSRRATVVVEHLVTFYDIPRDRLVPVGYGTAKLVDAATPSNPANERIELINIDALQ